jgi:hypothetical protein
VIPLFRSPVRLAWAATLVACLAAGALGFEVFQLRDRAAGLEQARAAAVEQLEEARSVETPPPVVAQDHPESDLEAKRMSEELSIARDQIAALETREAAQAERRVRQPGKIEREVPTVTVFVPLPTRASDEPTVVELGESERVQLQLELGPERPQVDVVVTVLREGQPVWRDPEVAVTPVESESMASLELPRKSLVEGRYRIELAEGETGDLLGTYEISVRR